MPSAVLLCWYLFMFRLFTEHLSGREYAVSNGRFGNRQRVGNDAEESLII